MPQGLFDALSGAATGHAMNRQGLEAAVANSQTINGLRSAQTENALLNAQKAREEQDANSRLETNLGGLFSGDPQRESKARAAADVVKGGGSAVQALQMLNDVQQNQFRQTMGDPNQLNQASQTAAAQGISGKLVEPGVAHDNMIVPAGVTPNIQQSPQGAAHTAQTQALTGEAVARAEEAHARAKQASTIGSTGGLDPDAVHAGAMVVMADPSKMSQYAGFGQSGQAIKTNINNHIAKMLHDSGMQPEDMIRQRAIAKASVGSTAQAAKQAETLDAFTPLVRSNGDRILQLLSQVGQDGGDVPVVAGLSRAAGRNLGSDDLAELHSVFGTYHNEIGRLLAAGPTMNGVISDTARREMQGMAPENMTTNQARRVINRINTEIGIRRASVQGAIESGANAQLPVTSLPSGGAGSAPAEGGAPAAAPAAIPLDQYLKSKGY